jgi:hypothetical protein
VRARGSALGSAPLGLVVTCGFLFSRFTVEAVNLKKMSKKPALVAPFHMKDQMDQVADSGLQCPVEQIHTGAERHALLAVIELQSGIGMNRRDSTAHQRFGPASDRLVLLRIADPDDTILRTTRGD